MRGVTVPTLLLLACAGAADAQAVSTAAATRFLEQATWGPTPASVAHLQAIGFTNWLDEQFVTAPSVISDVPPDANGREPMSPVQQQFFYNAVNGADQLRQRVAFALGEIWVTSAVKLTTADEVVPYLRLLALDAFASYPTIARDVTLSPSMGHYLDMVNNDKANAATGHSADENYAREVMQLFTIGLSELNMDGTPQLSGGQPVPTYDQDSIEGMARVLTGWTYPLQPGAKQGSHNPPYFEGQMVAVEANHDTGAKTFLGVTLPAGQTAEQDLSDALHAILSHPNVAPFVSRQLIQHLVTGNPSGAYVQRVATVFKQSNGDMKTVITAILLDPEARAGDDAEPAPGFGHLREPVLYMNGLLRGLGAEVASSNSLPGQANTLGQNVYYPPTVFNYFSPKYSFNTGSGTAITSVNSPEFQLLSGASAILRTSFVNTLVYGGIGGVTLDWTALEALTPAQMVAAADQALLGGRLTAQDTAAILSAVNAQTTAKAKAQAAVYLVASSSQYQVER
ncbi:MAG TPA: DUF1800 domain-containing protein [Bryobacteraceae bacterium]|nr:DUF1800 domain-containing protein [Bryobacteraceae bacterium]